MTVTAWPYRHVCLGCEVVWASQTVRPSPCPWCHQLMPHVPDAMRQLNRAIGTRSLDVGEISYPIDWEPR